MISDWLKSNVYNVPTEVFVRLFHQKLSKLLKYIGKVSCDYSSDAYFARRIKWKQMCTMCFGCYPNVNSRSSVHSNRFIITGKGDMRKVAALLA